VATRWTFQPIFKSSQTIATADSPIQVGAGTAVDSFQVAINTSLVDTDSPGPDTLVGGSYTLTNGAPTTIDLTAVPSLQHDGVNVDCTGKKLLGIMLATDPANTGTVTVNPHGTNGYDLFGASSLVILQRGEVLCTGMQKKTDGTLPTWGKDAVGASDKQIELSTSVTGSIVKIHMVFGD
jgi:hypothetical protein